MRLAAPGAVVPDVDRVPWTLPAHGSMCCEADSWPPQLAKLTDYIAKLVVRGGIEPPAFRFSAGFVGPGKSITGGLTRSDDMLAPLGIRGSLHASAAVVSKALARWRTSKRL